MCGCKLSKLAPFCDGMTCQQILKGEEFKIEEDLLYLEDEAEEEVPQVQEEDQP